MSPAFFKLCFLWELCFFLALLNRDTVIHGLDKFRKNGLDKEVVIDTKVTQN